MLISQIVMMFVVAFSWALVAEPTPTCLLPLGGVNTTSTPTPATLHSRAPTCISTPSTKRSQRSPRCTCNHVQPPTRHTGWQRARTEAAQQWQDHLSPAAQPRKGRRAEPGQLCLPVWRDGNICPTASPGHYRTRTAVRTRQAQHMIQSTNV